LILKEVGNPRQLWEAHASLASVYEKLRRESEARERWGAAVEVIQKQQTAYPTVSLEKASSLQNPFATSLHMQEVNETTVRK